MRPPRGRGSFGRDWGRGGGGRFGGAGRGRGTYNQDTGPPEHVVEAGRFSHPCEGEAVAKLTNEKIPYFNAPIFLENKSQIGKVEEVLGSFHNVYFTIKMSEGVMATSYKPGDKFYIDPMKLLPLERFLPKPKGESISGGGGRSRGGPGRRGGRGVFGRSPSRGAFARGGRGSSFGRGGGGRTPGRGSFGRGRGR